jgi:SsrA-binding protein
MHHLYRFTLSTYNRIYVLLLVCYHLCMTMAIKTVATNRKARHNYHIMDSVEAGLVLTGSEIKSIRAGRVSLGDAYVRPDNGELWLLNAHIARYQASSYLSHEPTRPRKLLLHRKEIAELASTVAEKGFTLVPLRLYIKDSIAKLEVALARGKKLYDKREAIQRRETDRVLERAVKTKVGPRR